VEIGCSSSSSSTHYCHLLAVDKRLYLVFQASHCALSVTLVVGLIYRFMLIAETVETFRSTYFEEFIDVTDVEYWDEVSYMLLITLILSSDTK